MIHSHPTHVRRCLLICAAAYSWSCGEVVAPHDVPPGHAALQFRTSVAGTSITGLSIEVTADDIPEAIIQNIEVVNDVGEGTIIVPAGSDRRIVVRAFNMDGIETHRGEATIDVVEGTNPTLEITLDPVFGEVPVVVRIGSWMLTIDPNDLLLAVGDQAQLSVTLIDNDGHHVSRPITWGSTNPAVASVDQNGLVTGLTGGEAEIVASYGAARDVATVVVLALEWASVAAGERHVCGLDVEGHAYCWGANGIGQLGNGVTGGMSTLPVPVSGSHVFSSIAPGGLQTCGITPAGEAFCWGRGNGGAPASDVPVPFAPTQTWSMIDNGIFHACGVTTAGEGYCWGFGGAGRLGHGTEVMSPTPVPVGGNHTWRHISAGDSHSCGITVDANAFCWGRGTEGQLGNGLAADTALPVPVTIPNPADAEFVSISAGGYHTCSVQLAGSVYCWGLGAQGQLGNGSTFPTATPLRANVVATSIDAGARHTCAVRPLGALCWGYGAAGQLGNGQTPTVQSTPVTVAGGIEFVSIAATDSPWSFGGSVSRGTTCGLSSAGRVYCWGSNPFGELGNGTTDDALTPTRTRDPA